MGYRIEYGPSECKSSNQAVCSGRILLLGVVIFGLFSMSVRLWWPEGWQVMRCMIFPGDLEAAGEAAEAFAQSVRDGMSLQEAIINFCEHVVSVG